MIETGQAMTIEVKAEGYMDKTSNYGASTTDTRNTIYLDKVVIFTVNVVDQYGGRIQGAKVTFNGETQTTESDGSATFTTSRGTYSYTVTYKGNTTEGTIIINQSDESVNVDFEKAIEDYRPTPNGNIQMLVKRNSLGTVHLQINSTTTEYVIDWGTAQPLKQVEQEIKRIRIIIVHIFLIT